MPFALPSAPQYSLRRRFVSSQAIVSSINRAAGFFTLGGDWVPRAEGEAALRGGTAVLVGGLLVIG